MRYEVKKAKFKTMIDSKFNITAYMAIPFMSDDGKQSGVLYLRDGNLSPTVAFDGVDYRYVYGEYREEYEEFATDAIKSFADSVGVSEKYVKTIILKRLKDEYAEAYADFLKAAAG